MQLTCRANLIYFSNVKNWLFLLTDAFGMDVPVVVISQKHVVYFGKRKYYETDNVTGQLHASCERKVLQFFGFGNMNLTTRRKCEAR